jgi:pyridine nucleotide-disulfide oxidoreductase family protein
MVHSTPRRLLLIGGGHAHLAVLDLLARSGAKARSGARDVDVVLVSPGTRQYYSGMIPGWMAGLYRLDECRIALPALASRARVRFIQDTVVGMDADQRRVRLSGGENLSYDILSLDIGSETDCSWLAELGDRLIAIKPLHEFQSAWKRVLEAAQESANYHLIVVGGGAAGVELAMAARVALRRECAASQVTLIAGDAGVLPHHGNSVQRRIKSALQRLQVKVFDRFAAGAEGGVLLGDGHHLEADHVIAATGALAPGWLAQSRLSLDSRGYVAIDTRHQSNSHKGVFAAGDICFRTDVRLAQSGVHAVHAGPILARNLLAAMEHLPLKPYIPRRRSLYLLASGDGRAVASWGPLSAEGAWVWRWKDRIDRHFIRRFSLYSNKEQE